MMKSKFVWLSISVAVTGTLFAELPRFQEHIDQVTYGYMLTILGLVSAGLKAVISTLEKKQD